MNKNSRNCGPSCQRNCSCSSNMPKEAPVNDCKFPLDSMNRGQLLNHLNEVSFAVDDILLYLDTHPQDVNALAYSREVVKMRNHAKTVYARRFGPLTIDCTNDFDSNSWEWILQPWPWENSPKGGCR